MLGVLEGLPLPARPSTAARSAAAVGHPGEPVEPRRAPYGAGPEALTAARTRSGSSAAQASACGPPPEWPMTANRSMPSASATAATSAAADADGAARTRGRAAVARPVVADPRSPSRSAVGEQRPRAATRCWACRGARRPRRPSSGPGRRRRAACSRRAAVRRSRARRSRALPPQELAEVRHGERHGAPLAGRRRGPLRSGRRGPARGSAACGRAPWRCRSW